MHTLDKHQRRLIQKRLMILQDMRGILSDMFEDSIRGDERRHRIVGPKIADSLLLVDSEIKACRQKLNVFSF